MSDTGLRHASDQEVRRRCLPNDARCAVCATTRQLTRRTDGTVVCYGHLDGPDLATELDHVAGEANMPSLTIEADANAHRRVEELRRLFGKYEWPDAGEDPLLRLAHLLAGVLTWGLVLCQWLVAVAGWLANELGPRWWESAPPFPFPA